MIRQRLTFRSRTTGETRTEERVMSALDCWRSPHFNRFGVALWGGIISATCLAFTICVSATGTPWYVAILFLLPAAAVVPIIFWAEALTASVRDTAARHRA